MRKTLCAAISVISRFAQYVPTCLAVIALRKKGLTSSFRIPFGPVLPVVSVIVSCWLLTKATNEQLLWGLGALVIGTPIYFILKASKEKDSSSKAA